MIVNGTRELLERYEDLQSGDVFIGPVGLSHLQAAIFLDLARRGVRCYPSALAQMLYRSKTNQTVVLGRWMLPHTRAITRRTEFMAAVNDYGRNGIGKVVTKQNRLHCGHGIRLWDSVEAVYSHLGLDEAAYPFVLQPFLPDFTDVRVIVVGAYEEAYTRDNPYNFRKNLSSGGEHAPVPITDRMRRLCREVMTRGDFPYAHLDFHVLADGTPYLSEIALNGGLKGAAIGRQELDRMKAAVLEQLAANGN